MRDGWREGGVVEREGESDGMDGLSWTVCS